MVHSVELLFDSDTDAALRGAWQALADAGLPSQARIAKPTNRPHVTVAVGEHLADDADTPLRSLSGRLPLPCIVGAPLLFGTGRFTLSRLIVPSAELVDFHAEVYRLCVPHLTPGPAAHSAPGQWSPHATLCRRISAAELAEALTVLRKMNSDLWGQFVALRHWDGDNRVERVLID